MRFGVSVIVAAVLVTQPVVSAQVQEPRATFRTAVNRVAVAATVRDKKGRPVTNLRPDDFELFDGGVSRAIIDFGTEQTPVSWRYSPTTAAAWMSRRAARRCAKSRVTCWRG